MGSGKGSGGGSSGTQQVNSTTTTSNLPEYARPYFESLMGRAQTISNDPYQSYGGQRVANFSADQNNAFNSVRNNQGIANTDFNTAASRFTNSADLFDQAKHQYSGAANAFTNASGGFDPQQVVNTYQAQEYNPNAWTDQGIASQYMSPYTQNVIDIDTREANRAWDIQDDKNSAAAQRGGAFGGYRHGIVEAEAQRNRGQQLGDIQHRGMDAAYTAGLGAFDKDRSAFMTSNDLNNRFNQQESSLGMQATDSNNKWAYNDAMLGMEAGRGLSGVAQGYGSLGQGMNQLGTSQMGLGTARQNAGITDSQSLLNIGAMQQDMSQRGLDVGYSDWLNQRDYGRQNLNWLSGILRGVPTTANTSVSSYQPSPSPYSQAAGLGLGAAGLAKMFG